MLWTAFRSRRIPIGFYRKFLVALHISRRFFEFVANMGRRRDSLHQRRNQKDFRPVVIAFILLFSIYATNFSTFPSSFALHSPATIGSSNTQSVSQAVQTVSQRSESRREVASSPATSENPSSSPVTYHGGPIQVQENVYLIFWLPTGQHFEPSGNDSNFEALITRYFNDIGGSQFYGILTQYPDTLDGSPTRTVHLAGAFVDSEPYPAVGNQTSPIFGSQIIGQIQNYIGSGSIPVGIDSVFLVFTAFGINTCQDSGETMCSFATAESVGYCAYHSYFGYDNSYVTYAEMGDNSNCEISLSSVGATAYPNNDAIADSEISLVSQEQFDIASDPLLTSWYSGSASTGEISDVCAGDYGPVSSTAGNIVINGHDYLVQLEWSNSAGACTLSPPATTSVSFTMTVNSGGNSVNSNNYFQMTFAIGKQLFVGDYTGQTLQFSADPGTTLSVSAQSSSSSASEEWCLSLPCQPYTVNLGTGTQSISIGYYDLLPETAIEIASGSPGSFDTVSYSTAPSTPGLTLSPVAVTLTFSSSSQTIFALRGSTMTVPQQTVVSTSSAQERWFTASQSITVANSNQLLPVESFQQYNVNYGYQIASGNTATAAPTILYFSGGQPETVNGGTSAWTDANSEFYYSPTLGTSSATERWAITPGTGTGILNSTQSLEITYYEQFNVSLSYSTVGGSGSVSQISFSGQSLGSAVSLNVGTSAVNLWLDAGSNYQLSNPISGSNPSERWYASSGTNGTVSSVTLSISPKYYNQYNIAFSYSVIGAPQGNQSIPSQPSVLFSSLGSTISLKLSTTAQFVWADAGSNYTLSTVTLGTNSGERWASNGSAGNVTQPGSFTFPLYYQLAVGFTILVTGGGAPGFALLNITSFGQNSTIEVTNSTSPTLWLDAGSSYALTNPIASNSASERWIASPANITGVVVTPRSVSIHYYNQYQETLSYSVVNGGSPGGPSVQILSLGTATNAPITSQGTSVWADAGSQYKFPSTLPDSSQSEAWNSNSTAASGIFNSATSVNIPYYHQYAATFITNTPSVQLPVSTSGWYDPGASLILTATTPSGWKFEGWSGTYSSNTPTLLLTIDSPVTETATFYSALVITTSGSGSITYSFGNVTGTVGQGHSETIYVPPNQSVKVKGSGMPVFFKFSGWSGNATLPGATQPGSNKTKLNTQNPLELSIKSPSSIVGEYAVNLFGIGILAAIIVVGIVAVILFFRRPHGEAEVEEAQVKEPQVVTAKTA